MTDDLEHLLHSLGNDRTQAPAHLATAIRSRLPVKQNLDIIGWFRSSFWRPVYAAALPMLIGFVTGAYPPSSASVYDVDTLLFAEQHLDASLGDLLIDLEGDNE